jgi:hypothetical protein
VSTQINVTVDSGGLGAKVKQQQNAARQAQLERERTQRVEVEGRTQRDAKRAAEGRTPDGQPLYGTLSKTPEIDRRPAANRYQQGSMTAVDYVTTTSTGVNPVFTLTVGPPGRNVNVVATTPAPSGAQATNLPASADTQSPEAVVGFLTTFPPDFFGFTWRTQYPCGTTFQTGINSPPYNSVSSSQSPQVVTNNYDDSAAYVLPIGKESCIFVYVYSKLRTLTVYRRITGTTRTSVNERIVTSGCNGQAGAYWDRETVFADEQQLDNIESRQAYKFFAFYVSPTTVRELEVPAQLTLALNALHPPLVINDATEQLASTTYTRYEFIDQFPPFRQNYNGPVTSGYSTIPYFNSDKHQQTTLHGYYYPENNDVLAKQYGLGNLNTTYHAGNYFTPAVYRFIRAKMNFDDPVASKSYSAMRSNYFPQAPNKYLAPCVLSGTCEANQRAQFDVTMTAPVNIDTAMPESAFNSNTRYKVSLNGVSKDSVLYGWDWDNPGYCRRQSFELGFSGADLTP